jgi:uncharacterized protein
VWKENDGFEDEPQEPVAIPYRELSPGALRGVVESFVLREGTDYGVHEFALEQKVAHVMAQLERREVQILFDPNTESVQIVKESPDSQKNRSPQGT